MSKQLQLGLVIEGNATDSAFLRMPSVVEQLGPVKSASLRVATRLSNVLRAGYGIAEYEELQGSDLILLRLPDSSVPRIVSELCSSDLVLKNRSFALCETWLPAEALQPLVDRGAAVATVVKVPTHQFNWFVLEGQQKPVRLLRQYLQQNGAKSTELAPGTKHLLFASELLAGALPIPLLLEAQQALRASGISGNVLWSLLEQMGQLMLQDVLRGGRRAWGGPLTECSAEVSAAHLDKLHKTHSDIAELIEQHLSSSRKVMEGLGPHKNVESKSP